MIFKCILDLEVCPNEEVFFYIHLVVIYEKDLLKLIRSCKNIFGFLSLATISPFNTLAEFWNVFEILNLVLHSYKIFHRLAAASSTYFAFHSTCKNSFVDKIYHDLSMSSKKKSSNATTLHYYKIYIQHTQKI